MKDTSQSVILIDDDQELCSLLADYLEQDGFSIDCYYSGQEALTAIETLKNASAIILDVMMPELSGFDVLKSLRPSINTPIIMLTGRGDEIDRIIGIEMGADDYLAKPCNPRELSARLKAVIRRTQPPKPSKQKKAPLQIHGITLDPGQRKVTFEGTPLTLTSTEFNVLAYLMESHGQVLSRAALTEKALHRKLTQYDRSIDVHVSRLRQKLSLIIDPPIIKTLRGHGYQLINE